MFACLYHPSLPHPSLDRFSPRVQSLDPHTALMDASGTSRIWPNHRQFASDLAQAGGPGCHVAVAATPQVALQVARHYEGIQIVHPGEESLYLNPLPIDVLPVEESFKDTLFEWGIRNLEEFLRLPESAVAERFGQDGLRAREWSLGQSPFLFHPHSQAELPQASLTLEYPVDTLEPLSFLIARLLQDLAGKVPAVNHLQLQLHLENKGWQHRDFPLAAPISDPRSLRRILISQLEKDPPRAAILAISLLATPCDRPHPQNHFFAAPLPTPDHLEPLLIRLQRLAGAENVGSPTLIHTHRPDSWILKPFPQPNSKRDLNPTAEKDFPSPLRYFRPALSVSVRCRGSVPVSLDGSTISGVIQAAKGPWIGSGNWWKQQDQWQRSEWDVQLESGGLYRIYQNDQNHWFVEGYYD